MSPDLPAHRLIYRSWRRQNHSLNFDEDELAAFLPLFLATGCGPLIWNRIRENRELSGSQVEIAAKTSWQTSKLFVAMQEEILNRVAGILEDAGIHVLMFKGRAVANYYHSSELRCIGDIDLSAPPGRYRELIEILAKYARDRNSVQGNAGIDKANLTLDLGMPFQVAKFDIHKDLGEYRMGKGVFTRSRERTSGHSGIHTLSPEDHLRLLCIHFVKHGGWRPLWLCDIAAMSDNLPADFDWDLCMRGETEGQWISIIVTLAESILGACSRMPDRHRRRKPPRWMDGDILKKWSTPHQKYFQSSFATMAKQGPVGFLKGLRSRWPDPIRATYQLGKPFDGMPQFPYQFAVYSKTSLDYAGRHTIGRLLN